MESNSGSARSTRREKRPNKRNSIIIIMHILFCHFSSEFFFSLLSKLTRLTTTTKTRYIEINALRCVYLWMKRPKGVSASNIRFILLHLLLVFTYLCLFITWLSSVSCGVVTHHPKKSNLSCFEFFDRLVRISCNVANVRIQMHCQIKKQVVMFAAFFSLLLLVRILMPVEPSIKQLNLK